MLDVKPLLLVRIATLKLVLLTSALLINQAYVCKSKNLHTFDCPVLTKFLLKWVITFPKQGPDHLLLLLNKMNLYQQS